MTKKKVPDYMLVSVSVPPALRDYLLSVNNDSDILFLDYRGPIWVAVKSRLRPVPADYTPEPIEPQPGKIRLVLPSTSAAKPLLNFHLDAVIYTNLLFRNYLGPDDQKAVAALLDKSFKDRYRSFMTGYLASHPSQAGRGPQIKEGIEEFCRIHRIGMDSSNITSEMLRKDWYRWRMRETPSELCVEVKENI